MGKRKLRNCSKCGTRHGPPTGKGCSRPQFEIPEEIEVQAPEADAALTEPLHGEDQQSVDSYGNDDQDVPRGQKTKKKEIFSTGDFINYPQCHGENRPSFADLDAGQAPSEGQQRWRRPRAEPEVTYTFEESMSERMATMENMLGRVAGI